ncbi:hypothetical protein ACFXPX_37470 [Kitasatospora sp. NPDC059146]|uniref:hypothetical protein n=1 Tax=unclassified Kitasatospora TaxID=2633591 RepID=UPI0036B4DC84
MTTPGITRRHRRRSTAPASAAQARPVRQPVPAPPVGRCCRTWSSEHLTRSGRAVRTTWHEPACRSWHTTA